VLYLNIHYRFEFPIPNWIPIKKTQPMQVKDDPPSVLLSSKSTPGPCDEKEPPYPVLRIQRDASAKQVLKTMIELSVFLRDVTPHQYYEALRYFIRSEPPEIRLIYKDFFSDECGCRMDPDDMEMMKYIVNDIVNERLVSTFKPAGNLTTANGNDGEATEELEKRSQWLKGKPFMERLQLIKKDTLSCNRAVKELLAFVNSTVDKAIKDCLEYEAIMADRNAGINDCRQKAKDAAERKALN